jgi:gliding motility-associated-like protein
LTTAGVILKQLEIYSRWGKRVWSTSDYTQGWNGMIDGKEAPIDTYYYVLRYKCTLEPDKDYIIKGDIILVR